MSDSQSYWSDSREIVERVVVTGDLVLLTPTHLGSGDAEGFIDMSLLLDPRTGTEALLTGASVAGALRNYLREGEYGYGVSPSAAEVRGSSVGLLFGGQRGDPEGGQSALIVDDARSQTAEVELRDGVCIDPESRTALVEEAHGRKRGYKFDLEVLQAGTTFPLRFELLIPRGKGPALKAALAKALRGLENGEIPLGARKRRGFGKCRVEKWRVVSYDLTTPQGLLDWLRQDVPSVPEKPDIANLLDVQVDEGEQRAYFSIQATFRLDGSLLVRSGFGESDTGPDTVHLHSYRPGEGWVPVLPGTSLAGVIRHRALRIVNTLGAGEKGATLVDEMFGKSPVDPDDRPTASRVLVGEAVVLNTNSLVQTRIKIDRFTGGAFATALFAEQPVFGGEDSRVTVELALRNPKDHEIGLLLLILKDLWTGDLAVGGESSVGRGRLAGVEASLQRRGPGVEQAWTMKQVGDRLEVLGDEKESLEACVQALLKGVQE